MNGRGPLGFELQLRAPIVEERDWQVSDGGLSETNYECA